MKRIEFMKKSSALMLCFMSLLLCGANLSFARGGWQNEVTLYGWLADIGGTVQAPTGAESDFTVEASDILEDLELMLMAAYEGHYNRWLVAVDFIYMDVGSRGNLATGAGTAAVDLNVSSYIVNGGIGYDFVQSSSANFGVVGGVRYLSLDVDYDASLGGMPLVSSSREDSLTDGFVGLRGKVNFNDNWFMPYYADIGTGGSDLSYQLYAAIGYSFGWGDVRLGYRHLGVEMDNDKVMKDLQLSGPIFGVGFRF